MKRFLQALMMLPIFGVTYAQQLPNAGFENWSASSFSTTEPDNWFSINVGTTDYPTYGVNSTTDAHGGQYAMKLTSGVFDLSSLGFPFVDTSAIAFLGSFVQGQNGPPAGIAFAYHPQKLAFYYKYEPASGGGTVDTARVFVDFKKNGTHVGDGEFKIYGSAVNSYTYAEIAINWTDSIIIPDTVRVDITSSLTEVSYNADPHDGNLIGNTLYVDDLSFIYPTTGIDKVKSELNVSIHPNPASDKLNISFKDANKDGATLNIYNVLGGLVATADINKENEQIDVRDLQNGYYITELKNDFGSSKKRILICK